MTEESDATASSMLQRSGPDIELRHLTMFLAVAEESSFTRAADVLRMTQPALSRAIAQLERRLGVRLLERSTHAVSLTNTGRNFLPHSRNVLTAFHEAISSVQGTTVFRVGFTWSAALELTPLIIREFERTHPDATVELRKFDDVYAGLTDGRTHLAFLRGLPRDSQLRSVTLFEEKRMAALHPSHPLASSATLTLDQIREDPLVVNTVSGITTPNLWKNPDEDREIVETRNLEEWLEAVGLGRGVGVTPASTSRLYPHPWIRYVPLAGAPAIPVVAAWPVNRSHLLAAEFVDIAVKMAAKRGN